ncbi:MAG: type I methionyl aminopeptidase [Paludibacteraceae bacterium]|nr:type I methionyl aminopeptidase [Paludibacteraceae bacterium]
MIFLKTDEEIELMKISNTIVAKTLAEVGRNIKPGITTLKLDKIAETFIRDNGAVPSFLGYNGFPNSICTSVNEQVVHGIPDNYELKEGDIVSVDCGALINGFHGDSCYTFTVGSVSHNNVAALLESTKAALYSGIAQAIEGRRLGDVSFAIQQQAEKDGFSVVREYTGHGIGRNMHEDPLVRNYGSAGYGLTLRRGMVIAIEPMFCMGSNKISLSKDGWTATTNDHLPAAHFEHTVAIGRDKAEILSSFDFIEIQ